MFSDKIKQNDYYKAKNEKSQLIQPIDLARPRYHEGMKNYHQEMKQKLEELPGTPNKEIDKKKEAVQKFVRKYKEFVEKHNELEKAEIEYKYISGLDKKEKWIDYSNKYVEYQQNKDENSLHALQDAIKDFEKSRNIYYEIQKRDDYQDLYKNAKHYVNEVKNIYATAVKEARDAKTNVFKYIRLEDTQGLEERINVLDNKNNKEDINNLQAKLEVIRDVKSKGQYDDPVITELECKINNLVLKEEALEGEKTDYNTTLENMKLFDTSLLVKTRDSLAKAHSYEAFDGKSFVPGASEILTEEDFQNEWLFADDTKDVCKENKSNYQSKLELLEKLQKDQESIISNKKKKLLPNKIESVVYEILGEMDQEIRGAEQYKSSLGKISSYLQKKCINLTKEYKENYIIVEESINEQLKILKQDNDKLLADLRSKIDTGL